jgi:CBS domain-containing protein
MKVARIFHPGSPYVEQADTLRDAAMRMRAHALSVLPVLSDGEVVGVLTERDVVAAMAKGVRPAFAHVADYMNGDGYLTVSVDDDAATAGVKMLTIGCRHLPVMDGGRLVGMVSASDVFLASARGDRARAGREGVLVS